MEKFDFHLSVDSQLKANGLRFDANETAAFSRELEYVHNEVIAAKYPDFKFRSICPLKTGAPLGANAHRWFGTDGFGEAAFLENMATEDFPTVEVQGEEMTGKIKSHGAKYLVTIEDLRAAQMMKVNVETEKAKLARRSIESLFDKVVHGAAATTLAGFKGILHNDNSTAYSGVVANWFTQTAVTGNPGLVVEDVRKAIDEAFIATKASFQQWDMFVSPEIGVLLDKPMSLTLNGVTTNLQMSIAQYMLQNLPRLRSITRDCWRFAAAGTGGTHRVLLYPRDPEVFDIFIPLDFEQFAPQLSGMAFTTHCHAKYGGVRMKHVKAVRRFDLAIA